MIDTAALKNRILALALTGQVANNKKDVKQLFESLCDNAYKIDKNKVSDKNYDLSEFPFEIPDNWKWVWIGDIFQHNTGKALNSSNTEGTSLEYITTSNLYWDRFELENLKTMLFKDSEIEKCTVRKGDLLICEGGDIGRSAIWSEDYEMRIQNHIHRLRPYIDDICARFYYYVMMYYKNNGLISGRGIGLQGLSSKRLHSILVPLPDIETQYVIAEKIDESFSVIDTIDELQSQYSSDIEVLKSKIIDAGIQGKLTEQFLEDGTAEELLEQIRNKKDWMINEGLIPKESASKKINVEDMIFDIPQNWTYARVQDVATYITDYVANGSFATLKANTTTYKEPNYAVFVRTLDLGAKFQNELSYIDEASYEFLKKSKLYGGELILPNIGASIGKAFIMPDLGIPMSLAPNSVMVKLENDIMNKYFYYVFQSSYGKGILMNIQGGAATPKFSKTDLRKMIVMLPPLAEQERIVNRIEEIFALIQ